MLLDRQNTFESSSTGQKGFVLSLCLYGHDSVLVFADGLGNFLHANFRLCLGLRPGHWRNRPISFGVTSPSPRVPWQIASRNLASLSGIQCLSVTVSLTRRFHCFLFADCSDLGVADASWYKHRMEG